MKHLIPILLLFSFFCGAAKEMPKHCETEPAKIDSILKTLSNSKGTTKGDRIVLAAESLIGMEEDDYYFTDSIASLRLNVDSFTPLMFINTVIAFANASESPGEPDYLTFSKEFESVACRRGENTGFPSIMYHTSDWIGDNMARGIIREYTEDFSGTIARTKSLDEMTRYRGNWEALKDSATFETVRMTEMGFRTHRIPTLKKETVKKKEVIEEMQNGDIIIFVSNRDGIDMYDLGIIKMENSKPYLIHLSPIYHKIMEEPEDLVRYMSLMTKHFQGYRLLRLKD